MREALRALLHELRYAVPAQDLTIHLRRTPALPAGRPRIADVALTG